MIRRVSSYGATSRLLEQMKRVGSRGEATRDQISTQSRLGSLRDDPIAAAHAVRLASSLTRIARFSKNIQTLSNRLREGEGFINQGVNVLQRVRELAVQAANGTYTKEDRRDIAVEVNQLLDEMVSTANGRSSQGDYLFAGTKTRAKPFEAHMGSVAGITGPAITQVVYRGNNNMTNAQIDRNNFIRSNFSGSYVFASGPQNITSPVDSRGYSVPQAAQVEVDGVTVQLAAGDSAQVVADKINASGAPVKVSFDPQTFGMTISTTTPHKIFMRDLGGANVLQSLGLLSGQGGAPYNLDPGVTGNQKDLFRALIDFRTALLSPKSDYKNIGGSILGNISQSLSRLTEAETDLGGRTSRMKLLATRLSSDSVVQTGEKDEEVSTDMTKAIVELKTLETVKEGIYGVTSRLFSHSLMDYLR